jgi:fumarate hydratase class II
VFLSPLAWSTTPSVPSKFPHDRYWGAQTQRALRVFEVGEERFPPCLIHALGTQKLAAARATRRYGTLDIGLTESICTAARELRDGRFDAHFPLTIWQTGSGTQTNMNANEVIANRANELLGQPLGTKAPVHPNDHVNASQSSNGSSGPRCGLAELVIPDDGLTSSIMPGKRNPTIAEVVVQANLQVKGNHVTITKPVLIYNLLQSIRTLADSSHVFAERLVRGLGVNTERLAANVESALLLVTALNPGLGYDRVAQITKRAQEQGVSPKDAAIALGFLDGDAYDRIVNPRKMAGLNSSPARLLRPLFGMVIRAPAIIGLNQQDFGAS